MVLPLLLLREGELEGEGLLGKSLLFLKSPPSLILPPARQEGGKFKKYRYDSSPVRHLSKKESAIPETCENPPSRYLG
jgi:hypothetical protein